jgi:hypothetical protein
MPEFAHTAAPLYITGGSDRPCRSNYQAKEVRLKTFSSLGVVRI